MKKSKLLFMLIVFMAFFSIVNIREDKLLGVQTISSITAYTNLSDIKVVVGERKVTPEVHISTPNITLSTTACYWMKKNGNSWSYYSGQTFEKGTYKYHLRFEVSADIATLSNSLTINLDGKTTKVTPTTSSNVYYCTVESAEIETKDQITYTATAKVAKTGTGKVWFGTKFTDASDTASFTYAQSKYDKGMFTCAPMPGFIFKEWRVGSENGIPVTITEEDLKKEEYKNLDPDVYLDKNNAIHFKQNQDYKFFAILERDPNSTLVLKGDVNFDDFVNATDSSMVLDYFKDTSKLNDVLVKVSDMNDDGFVNSTDAAMILDVFKNGNASYVEI